MFIDYIPLMLINMVGGLLVLAGYILFASGQEEAKSWSPAFGAVGLVALLTGLHMSLTWPITLAKLQFANVAFGEMSVLFGVLFLAAALALRKKWSLLPISIYAFVAGGMAIVIGIRLWLLWLTKFPPMTGMGFILTGAGGVLAGLFLWLRKSLLVRIIAAVVMLAAAGIWALTAFGGYWVHLKNFST